MLLQDTQLARVFFFFSIIIIIIVFSPRRSPSICTHRKSCVCPPYMLYMCIMYINMYIYIYMYICMCCTEAFFHHPYFLVWSCCHASPANEAWMHRRQGHRFRRNPSNSDPRRERGSCTSGEKVRQLKCSATVQNR